MKKLFTLFLLCSSISVFAQGTQPPGNAMANLDVSNINPTILTGGDMFRQLPVPHNSFHINPAFEVPRGSGIHSILTGALWIGGKDPQNNLYVAETTYRQNSWEVGYWPGPISNHHDPAHSAKYDKIWKVSKAQIQHHVANFNKPGYVAPADLLSWPGNGNPANGESAQLAPYVDVNNDGIYTPQAGDYPEIKGDQALYLILNDKGNVNWNSSPSLNAEIHVMYYGFNNPANGPVYNTLFSEYRIINRGPINFHDFYAGLWMDFDLGFWGDDLVGCDNTTNRFFVYNGDNFDEDVVFGNNPGSPTPAFTVKGYGANPPVQSVAFLDQRLSHFMYYNNSMSPVNGQANSPVAKYNLLRGTWNNGTPLTYGGDGTDQTNPPATHMFPGDPVSGTGWSEMNTLATPAISVPGARRGVGSIGPFTLNAGQELKFTVAYNYSRGTSNLNSVTQSKADAVAVQNFFRSQILATPKPVTPNTELVLFPNPATDKLTIQLPVSFTNKAVTVQVSDYTGRTVLQTTSRQNGSNLYLNISSLSKGIYQVKVTSENQVRTARLVKL